MDENFDPFDTYQVVVNAEEQYSLWPRIKPLPAGWTSCGVSGSKQDCLDYIEATWTNILPLSVRRRLEEAENAKTQDLPTAPV